MTKKNLTLSQRIGGILKILRSMYKVPVEQISKEIGVSILTTYKMEGGNYDFKVSQLEKISKVFEVTIHDLIEGHLPVQEEEKNED